MAADAQTRWLLPLALMHLAAALASWEILEAHKEVWRTCCEDPCGSVWIAQQQMICLQRLKIAGGAGGREGWGGWGWVKTWRRPYITVWFLSWLRPLLGGRRHWRSSRHTLGRRLRETSGSFSWGWRRNQAAMLSVSNSQWRQCRPSETARDLQEKKRMWVTKTHRGRFSCDVFLCCPPELNNPSPLWRRHKAWMSRLHDFIHGPSWRKINRFLFVFFPFTCLLHFALSFSELE